MAASANPKPTALRALVESFAQQLLTPDSPYIESQNVVLQIRVPIPNCSTSLTPTRTPTRTATQSYTYTYLDISIPTKLFLASEGQGLQAAWRDFAVPFPCLTLMEIVRSAIEDTVGVKVHEQGPLWRGPGPYCGGDEAGPGVEISSVRIVPKGDVDLGEEGYHVLVASSPAEGECQKQQHPIPVPTIDSKPINPLLSLVSPCRYFLPADYTIYLKSDSEGDEGGGGGGFVSTFHVNRFLLGLRIPYFRSMFSSRMADSGTNSSALYTDIFSPQALTIICRYIYLICNPQEPNTQEPRDLLWFCGVPGQSDDENEAQLGKLRDYIYLDHPEATDAIGGVYSTRIKSCTKESPPPASILTHLVNIVKAADYLGLDDLKSYIIHTFTELAHNFNCRGPGCAVVLPKMLDKVYHEPLIPRSLLDSLVKHLGKANAVQSLWKQSLIKMSPEAISHLLTHIQMRILHDPVVKRTNEGGGTLAAFALYVALAKLYRQVLGKSRNADAWEEKLLDPLMKDFLARLLAGDLCWCEYLVSRGAAGLDIDITQGLVRSIVSRFMTRENCERIWRVASNRELEFWDEQAMRLAVEWFRKEWLSLSVTPPEPDPRTSARPPTGPAGGGGSGGVEVAAVAPMPQKTPRMKEAYEPNFFATWDRRDLDLLGREVGVEVEDLLAQGHRAGLPPMTPRRSVGAGMGELGRRRALGGSDGGAVIPPVGSGGGRTGQSSGATLLNAPGGSIEGGDDVRDSRLPSPAPASTAAATTTNTTTSTRVLRGSSGINSPGSPRPAASTTAPRGTLNSTSASERETAAFWNR